MFKFFSNTLSFLNNLFSNKNEEIDESNLVEILKNMPFKISYKFTKVDDVDLYRKNYLTAKNYNVIDYAFSYLYEGNNKTTSFTILI